MSLPGARLLGLHLGSSVGQLVHLSVPQSLHPQNGMLRAAVSIGGLIYAKCEEQGWPITSVMGVVAVLLFYY